MDHEALWKVSRQWHLPHQQAVEAEEVVEGEQDRVQPQPGEGDLRHLQIHRQSPPDWWKEVRHATLRPCHLIQTAQSLPLQTRLLQVSSFLAKVSISSKTLNPQVLHSEVRRQRSGDG